MKHIGFPIVMLNTTNNFHTHTIEKMFIFIKLNGRHRLTLL